MDPATRYTASISACADFAPGTFVEADLAVARAVTPARMRAFAQGLAEPWLQLADVLEHLVVRGWTFVGAAVEPGSLVAEIRKYATSAELYDDIASLPAPLLEWVNHAGLFVVPDGSTNHRDPSFAVRCTPSGWSIVSPRP